MGQEVTEAERVKSRTVMMRHHLTHPGHEVRKKWEKSTANNNSETRCFSEKTVSVLNKFLSVGGVAVNFDPIHAAVIKNIIIYSGFSVILVGLAYESTSYITLMLLALPSGSMGSPHSSTSMPTL